MCKAPKFHKCRVLAKLFQFFPVRKQHNFGTRLTVGNPVEKKKLLVTENIARVFPIDNQKFLT